MPEDQVLDLLLGLGIKVVVGSAGVSKNRAAAGASRWKGVGSQHRIAGPASVVAAVDMEQFVALVDLVADAVLLHHMAICLNIADIAELLPSAQAVWLARGKPRGLVVHVSKLAGKRYMAGIIQLRSAQDRHTVLGHGLPPDGLKWCTLKRARRNPILFTQPQRSARKRLEGDTRIDLGRSGIRTRHRGLFVELEVFKRSELEVGVSGIAKKGLRAAIHLHPTLDCERCSCPMTFYQLPLSEGQRHLTGAR